MIKIERKITKRDFIILTVSIVVLLAIFGIGFIIKQVSSDKNGSKYYASSIIVEYRAKVMEVISRNALIVEIIPEPWNSYNDDFLDDNEDLPRDEYTLLSGNIVKVVFDNRMDWAYDELYKIVDVGSIIGFEQFHPIISGQIDFSQEPFIVESSTIRGYTEDGKTVIFEYRRR